MGIIRTIRLLAYRMVTGARHGSLAARSSAQVPGITFIIAIPAIGRSTAVAGIADTMVMATTDTPMDTVAMEAIPTTAVAMGMEDQAPIPAGMGMAGRDATIPVAMATVVVEVTMAVVVDMPVAGHTVGAMAVVAAVPMAEAIGN